MEQRWIPVNERLPDADKYILVSIENFIISDIGRYETDKDGSGAFYPGDDGKSYVEYGLFVNAWMPLPEPYREVFMWRVFADLSYKQIGDIFSKTDNWACVTYHRARKMIKNRLEDSSYEE